MTFEVHHIQQAFMRHLNVQTVPELKALPDGDYIVPVYDEEFNVRVTDNKLHIMPQDFDPAKATRIK